MKHREKIKLLIVVHLFLLIFLQPIRSQMQTVLKVPAYPYETCIVDYDLDGDNDIIVGCNFNYKDDSIVFFINDGWGNFTQQQFATNGAGFLYCIDLTNDFYPEIISRDADSIFFYENPQSVGIGTGYFIKDTFGNPFIGGLADINTDGLIDIVNYDITIPNEWGVTFNNGDYSFTDSAFVESNDQWSFLCAGNIDNDNKPDILISTVDQSENVHVLYNKYPIFEKLNIATPDWNRGYILNVDNDSLNDVLLFKVSYFGKFPLVNMINKGDYFFGCDTLSFVNGSDIKNICDYNLDGYDDITMSVYQATNQPIEDSIYIYFNDQECGYIHSQSVFMGEYGWLPTVNHGDLNSDGYPELVIQGYHFPLNYIRILWNDGTGHFIDTNSVYVYQNEIDILEKIEVYPNPSSDKFIIQSHTGEINGLKIFDINGRLLIQFNNLHGKSSHVINFNTWHMKKGVYLCLIQLKNEIYVLRKLIFN